jgi:hypothetical protein
MQFKRAANIYFLWISILTLMPFSPKVIYTFTVDCCPYDWYLLHGVDIHNAEGII